MNRKGFQVLDRRLSLNSPLACPTRRIVHSLDMRIQHTDILSESIRFPRLQLPCLAHSYFGWDHIPSAPSCHRKRQAHNNLLRLHEPTHRRHIHPYAGSANHSENEYWVRPPRHTPGLSRLDGITTGTACSLFVGLASLNNRSSFIFTESSYAPGGTFVMSIH